MKLLVDMNLSPEWVEVLSRAGWQVIHWSTAGPATAADTELLAWARDHNYVVLTQDLDSGQLLFHTREIGPSVVLLRIRKELDPLQQARICQIPRMAQGALETGALVSIDERRARLRRLPIQSGDNT